MNYVIFGQGRTGSTLLVRLLQSHPHLQCDGEILNVHMWKQGVSRYVRWLVRYFPEPLIFWRAHLSAKPAYGFKLLYTHVAFPRRLVSSLCRTKWQVIHIQRRNIFDVAVSRKVAQTTKHWSDYRSSLPNEELQLIFSSDELFEQMKWCLNVLRREVHTLYGIPHISVIYEDDLLYEDDRQRICGMILFVLQIEPHQVFTTKSRSWNRPYSELVINYADLQALMQTEQGKALQTEWERLIEHG